MSYFSHLRTRISPLRNYFVPVSLSVLTLIFVDNSLASVCWVRGNSMAPSLSPLYNETGRRDAILVFKRDVDRPIAHTRYSIHRGDVVVYWKPSDPEEMGVKRVLATEGDFVIRDLRRVGRENTHGHKMGMAEVPPIVKVPEGHIWVEGDNWRDSLDSNDFGPISLTLVVGKAVGILWPFTRFGDIPQRPEKEKSRAMIRPQMSPGIGSTTAEFLR